jgi:hypothetical protein
VDDEAEAIFFSLASQASTPDLKAKKLLFDVMVKLQQANICHPSDGLPEIALDDGQTAEDAVSAEIDRVAAAIGRDTARPAQMASERRPQRARVVSIAKRWNGERTHPARALAPATLSCGAGGARVQCGKT